MKVKPEAVIVGAACAVCCAPLIVAAGPAVLAGGAVAAAGVAAHVARRGRGKKADPATAQS